MSELTKNAQSAYAAAQAHYKDPWSTKKKVVISAWALANISLFPFFISVCVATGTFGDSGQGATGFMLVWTFLHCLALLIGGSLVLAKYMTPISYGFFACATLIMASWMLQTSIVIGHYTCQKSISTSECLDGVDKPDAVRASVAFGVFLFLGYLATGLLLLMYKKDLLAQADEDAQDRTAQFLEGGEAAKASEETELTGDDNGAASL